jgi:hypothetical protein
MEGERIAGNAITGGANAQAAGTIGSANAWSQGIGGVSSAVSQYYQNKSLSDLIAAQKKTPK